MAKKKIYAVRQGKTTGIFYSWDECSASVNGYPGAEYKSFTTKEEANSYLENSFAVQIEEEKKDQKNTALDGTESTLTAYVDGSFDPSIGKYAFGCILLTPDGEIIRESGNGQDPESLAIRNVAGEMLGAMYAVQWAVNHGYPSLTIYYDYEGIAKWAKGDWKAKNKRTQQYAEFMNGKRSYIQLSFQKVKAHSGDHYNEEVDKLAKSALVNGNGIPRISRTQQLERFW